jgi:hypothetical protein
LSFERGAHLLLKRALRELPLSTRLAVTGSDPALRVHLRAWCREQGLGFEEELLHGDRRYVGDVIATNSLGQRWIGAERAGEPAAGAVQERAKAAWGLAARGALIEAGGPDAGFDLDTKPAVWSDLAPRLYAQAAASQWDPASLPWDEVEALPAEVEAAVRQVMTYLVENEQAALAVPARFLGRIHPHFREVVQFLAVQVADEARHAEVFARRAALAGHGLGVSTVSSRASLTTLLSQPDFSLASFMLSVLGEGTFLNLLAFLEQTAPDRITREITHLARQDETRHVAFAMGHLESQLAFEPALRSRMKSAIESRHEALQASGGLAEEVFDALVLLAAGSWEPSAIQSGYEQVMTLEREMAEGRERRLLRLGFQPSEASALSLMHTRNFM